MNGFPTPAWQLRSLQLTNILGFSGQRDFHFGKGLQVVYAPNHTGKTSLAIALLWCLTGQLPSIGRISGNQFKIKHKAAGDKETASAVLVLDDGGGQPLEIRRTAKSGAKTAKLTVLFMGIVYEDAQAQDVISSQIGLQHHSLEGCRIVLQDQRLGLIAGDMKKSSEVIHDILGLSTLSKLIPILNDKISQLKKVIGAYEHLDPRLKWEEKHAALVSELKEKETEAQRSGCHPNDFRQSGFLEKELNRIREGLAFPPFQLQASVKDMLTSLREALKLKRQSHPLKAKQKELEGAVSLVKETIDKVQLARQSAKEAAQAYAKTANSCKLTVQQIPLKIQALEETVSAKQSSVSVLKEQHSLYHSSLKLLDQQHESCLCPLCEQPVDRSRLIVKIRANMDAAIFETITTLEKEIKQLCHEKEHLEEIRRECLVWERTLHTSTQQAIKTLTAAGHSEDELIPFLENALIRSMDLLAAFDKIGKDLHDKQQRLLNEVAQTNNLARHEEEQLTPLEHSLDRIALYLVPIHDVHRKLLDHEKGKEEQEAKGTGFSALLEKARRYLNQLNEFKNILQVKEKEKANNTVLHHQNFVTDFFVKVAGHPIYDKIAITAEEDRGSVKYGFEASSTTASQYTDIARHVLSGGDLSCACLGLILSLTRGSNSKADFLVLDDPGECLDATRMANLANVLHDLGGRQTIILTHQKELADNLLKAGASALNL